MIGNQVNKIVISELKKFFESYNETNEEEVSEDLIEKAIEYFKEPKKIKKTKKEVESAERCIALTTKKTQCTSKITNDEQKLCTVHSKKGIKHGTIHEPLEEQKEKIIKIKKEDDDDDDDSEICQYIYKKGKNNNKKCGKPVLENYIFCKIHTPKKVEKIKKDKIKSKEIVSDSDKDDIEKITISSESEDIEGSDLENQNSDDN